MANRIFISAVVVLWLSSMTWLVTERILPSITGGGQPPITKAYEQGEAVAWRVIWRGNEVGKAASIQLKGVGGSTDLFNRVVLEEFPIMELAPSWLRATVGKLGHMTFDVMTRVEFDPLGKFSSFNSRISLNDMPSILRMSGRVEDSHLKLRVHARELSHRTQIYLPNSETLSEALFPDAKLPYLHIGRSWQEKIYSPFSSPASPVELVEVEVVARETVEYEGDLCPVLRVEYKSLNSTGISSNSRLQGISWVDPKSGDVLRRDVYLGDSKLRFERLSKEEATQAGLDLFEHKLFFEAAESTNREAAQADEASDQSPELAN